MMREQAIQDFAERGVFDEKARILLEKVLTTQPASILVAWEDHEGNIQASSHPSSHALARGILDSLYEALHSMEEED